jgi:hypothetical protein
MASSYLTSEFTTPLHPCSIETLSLASSTFVIGLYELDESGTDGVNSSSTRNGGISISTVRDGHRTARTHDCASGVLDVKINASVIAAAHAGGALTLYRLNDKHEQITSSSNVSKSSRGSSSSSSGGRGGSSSSGSSSSGGSSSSAPLLSEVASVSRPEEGLFLSVDWDRYQGYQDRYGDYEAR